MLSFSPNLAEISALNSHRSTLEAFGKKVEEKAKTLRAAELLFAAKKADWTDVAELAEEIRANSKRVIVLCEGLCHALFQAVQQTCTPVSLVRGDLDVRVVSSTLHAGSLKSLAQSIVGEKVSIFLVYHNAPSERLVWCFRALVAALHKNRHADEARRRVIVTTGQPATKWERWAQKSHYRTLSFPPRCAGRYFFFSEPTAFLLSLLGLEAWKFVEGARSFYRQYDKLAETDDPILAYAALREVQLAEHYRETLVLPDETYQALGDWWKVMTEDSRREFAEENHDGLIWAGSVMKERASAARLHWVTEISLDSEQLPNLHPIDDLDSPPHSGLGIERWEELETSYQCVVEQQRAGLNYAQPSVKISLRRRDPYCLGSLFVFFESVVSASHRLAETTDDFSLLVPHTLSKPGVTS